MSTAPATMASAVTWAGIRMDRPPRSHHAEQTHRTTRAMRSGHIPHWSGLGEREKEEADRDARGERDADARLTAAR